MFCKGNYISSEVSSMVETCSYLAETVLSILLILYNTLTAASVCPVPIREFWFHSVISQY